MSELESVVIKTKAVRNGNDRIVIPREKDYVIVRDDTNKDRLTLVQVESVNDERLECIYEKDRWLEDKVESGTFRLAHLAFNLGPDPAIGTIMGVKVEPWRKTIKTPLGHMHFFITLDEDDEKRLRVCLKKIAEKIEPLGWNSLLPLELQVRKNGGGKEAGSYKCRGEDLDLLTIKLKAYEKEQIYHLMYHELGHGLWAHKVSLHSKGRWVRAYHDYVRVTTATEDMINEILDDFLKAGSGYSAPNEQMEEISDDVFAWLEEYHKVRWEDLCLLVDGNQHDVIKDMWPSVAALTEHDTILTEYAKTNPEEFFCEAIALHMQGKSLPKRLDKLMTNTLKDCK